MRYQQQHTAAKRPTEGQMSSTDISMETADAGARPPGRRWGE
jgi:hypothetical protein